MVNKNRIRDLFIILFFIIGISFSLGSISMCIFINLSIFIDGSITLIEPNLIMLGFEFIALIISFIISLLLIRYMVVHET